MVEPHEDESIEFKWGIKRGIGGKRKDVRFYESFTFDGVEYSLYDSVFLYNEAEAEPYIGKLIKIWENSDKTKKVKILWFFHPYEILNYLGAEKTFENELFLASGVGVGLANVNPLESIAGKCNVLCISKDSRNPQPSNEELQMADYIFYRTFDVGSHMILDNIDEKIAGIEVKFLFNRADRQKSSGGLKIDFDEKEANGKNTLEECNYINTDVSFVDASIKANAAEVLLVNHNSLHGEKLSSCVGEESAKMANVDNANANISNERTPRSKVLENATSNVSLVKQKSVLEEKPTSSCAQRSEAAKINDRHSNSSCDKTNVRSKDKEDVALKASIEQRSLQGEKRAPNLVVGLGEMPKRRHGNILKEKIALKSKDESIRSKSNLGARQVQVEEQVKSIKGSYEWDDRPSKKAKLDGSNKQSDDKNKKKVPKINHSFDSSDVKVVARAISSFEDNSNLKLGKISKRIDNSSFKNPSLVEEYITVANSKLPNGSPGEALIEGNQIVNQTFDVAQRPEADKSKWFRGLPWEDRMRTAQEHETLILLQNLDPSYTSSEVEDIVWHAFKESCTARIIPRTTFSSPHYGQAFVIFKTRVAAMMALKKLDEGCLLQPNGRPLVGSIATPCFPEKRTSFVGHLVIDKLRPQMQRVMKEAVSTSHCSQPNTIEYDMAMEWCLLQESSGLAWKKFHKQQGEELRKLKSTLKSK